jgi:uncharacterized repeat protein (TIGR01451 family)
VVNDANDTDTIEVSGSSSNGWTPIDFYLDVNGNGVYDSGTDTALTNTNGSGGVDTGALPDSVSNPGNNDVDILACLTVPAATTNGTTDDLTVNVESAADSNETGQAVDTTTVSAPALTVSKAVSPTGNQPPGTTLTYTITISNAAGSGQANNVVLTDPIPTNTTYVGSSITQDAAARGDGTADGDNADHNVTTAGAVTVTVGNMAGGTSTTITFQVTID